MIAYVIIVAIPAVALLYAYMMGREAQAIKTKVGEIPKSPTELHQVKRGPRPILDCRGPIDLYGSDGRCEECDAIYKKRIAISVSTWDWPLTYLKKPFVAMYEAGKVGDA